MKKLFVLLMAVILTSITAGPTAASAATIYRQTSGMEFRLPKELRGDPEILNRSYQFPDGTPMFNWEGYNHAFMYEAGWTREKAFPSGMLQIYGRNGMDCVPVPYGEPLILDLDADNLTLIQTSYFPSAGKGLFTYRDGEDTPYIILGLETWDDIVQNVISGIPDKIRDSKAIESPIAYYRVPKGVPREKEEFYFHEERIGAALTVGDQVSREKYETFSLYDGRVILNSNLLWVNSIQLFQFTEIPEGTLCVLENDPFYGPVVFIPLGIKSWEDFVANTTGLPEGVDANTFKDEIPNCGANPSEKD